MPEMSWKDAILHVLREAGTSLHYQEITKAINDHGLRSLTGLTPEATVSANLAGMVKEANPQIRKTSRGHFQFLDPSIADIPDIVDEEIDDDEPGNQLTIRVAAYGLGWDRGLVDWATSQILGRAYPGGPAINFAQQHGIYLLYQDRSPVYVGQTQDSLFSRLKHHDAGKQARWDKFSWFGFREVNDQSGELKPLTREVDVARFIDLLEAVLIEVIAPPVNWQSGKHMGTLYQQAPSPSILERQRRDFHRNLAG